MNIYLVRHPPPMGADGICYGDWEVAVDDRAAASIAESIAAKLSPEALAGARIHSSPSSRCLGLARRLASPREPVASPDLLEMNFGDWQGLRWDDIERSRIDDWSRDIWNYRPGGGESAQMVAVRWDRWLDRVTRGGGGDVVAVTHAGVIRVALARSGPDGASALTAPIPFGSVSRLDLKLS
jgi:alpha-ribazole phosphatase